MRTRNYYFSVLIVLFLCCAVPSCNKAEDKPVEATAVQLSQEVLDLTVGDTVRLSAFLVPENAVGPVVVWSSTDEGVASVDEQGLVTALGEGETVILAKSGALGASCRVNVSRVQLTSLNMDRADWEMPVGDDVCLGLVAAPLDAVTSGAVWSSSNNAVVTVNDGKVNAVSAGQATVTASLDGFSAVCDITVVEKSVSIGEYLYSDGTHSAMLDSGKEVVAIVFWVGNPGKDDPLLRKEYPECTHGLAVAVNDVASPWQSSYRDASNSVAQWCGASIPEYESVLTGTSADGNMNRILGFNNTRAIMTYNGANLSTPVETVSFVEEYSSSNPAPDNTSGWYLPSVKEVFLLCYGDYDGNIWDYEGDVSRPVWNTVNNKLENLTGGYAELDGSVAYWSSSECGGSRAFGVFFMNGVVVDTYKDYGEDKARCVLAF